jgi:adenylate cyclase, class 2
MTKNTEIEAKYAVLNLESIANRLKVLGANEYIPRTREINWRFDTPEGDLRVQGRALRLRKYNDTRVTYKGPGNRTGAALTRTEIEFGIDDMENARLVLEALGYKLFFIYEKYRAIWDLDDCHIMLDETPLGNFVEIEASSPEGVLEMAKRLQIAPQHGIPASYQRLFERVKHNRDLTFRDMTFKNFTDLQIEPIDFDAQFAD